MYTFTGGCIEYQDLRYAQKPVYFPIFTSNIWSYFPIFTSNIWSYFATFASNILSYFPVYASNIWSDFPIFTSNIWSYLIWSPLFNIHYERFLYYYGTYYGTGWYSFTVAPLSLGGQGEVWRGGGYGT